MTKDLFAEFPYTSAEQWLAQIRKDLKGKSPEEMLWSPDGTLWTDPFVHAEHCKESLSPLPAFGQWEIGETFVVGDVSETHNALHEALMGGAESLHLICSQEVDWPELLKGIELPMIHLGIEWTGGAKNSIVTLENYVKTRFPNDDVRITVIGETSGISNVSGIDPP